MPQELVREYIDLHPTVVLLILANHRSSCSHNRTQLLAVRTAIVCCQRHSRIAFCAGNAERALFIMSRFDTSLWNSQLNTRMHRNSTKSTNTFQRSRGSGKSYIPKRASSSSSIPQTRSGRSGGKHRLPKSISIHRLIRSPSPIPVSTVGETYRFASLYRTCQSRRDRNYARIRPTRCISCHVGPPFIRLSLHLVQELGYLSLHDESLANIDKILPHSVFTIRCRACSLHVQCTEQFV
jgi:hypothetical protein